MANEAVILSLAGQPKGVPINFTVDSGISIEKGTLMQLSGAAAVRADATTLTSSGKIFVGIAATEHVSGAGTTLGLKMVNSQLRINPN